MKMTTKPITLRLSDISLNDKLKAGVTRFTISATQAYCGTCHIYLTMFAQWDNNNYDKSVAELNKHIEECHANREESKSSNST